MQRQKDVWKAADRSSTHHKPFSAIWIAGRLLLCSIQSKMSKNNSSVLTYTTFLTQSLHNESIPNLSENAQNKSRVVHKSGQEAHNVANMWTLIVGFIDGPIICPYEVRSGNVNAKFNFSRSSKAEKNCVEILRYVSCLKLSKID